MTQTLSAFDLQPVLCLKRGAFWRSVFDLDNWLDLLHIVELFLVIFEGLGQDSVLRGVRRPIELFLHVGAEFGTDFDELVLSLIQLLRLLLLYLHLVN